MNDGVGYWGWGWDGIVGLCTGWGWEVKVLMCGPSSLLLLALCMCDVDVDLLCVVVVGRLICCGRSVVTVRLHRVQAHMHSMHWADHHQPPQRA